MIRNTNIYNIQTHVHTKRRSTPARNRRQRDTDREIRATPTVHTQVHTWRVICLISLMSQLERSARVFVDCTRACAPCESLSSPFLVCGSVLPRSFVANDARCAMECAVPSSLSVCVAICRRLIARGRAGVRREATHAISKSDTQTHKQVDPIDYDSTQ